MILIMLQASRIRAPMEGLSVDTSLESLEWNSSWNCHCHLSGEEKKNSSKNGYLMENQCIYQERDAKPEQSVLVILTFPFSFAGIVEAFHVLQKT